MSRVRGQSAVMQVGPLRVNYAFRVFLALLLLILFSELVSGQTQDTANNAFNVFADESSDRLINSNSRTLPTNGLVARFDSDQVRIDGENVLEWTDQSGFGNHLLAIGDPKLIQNALGAQPAIELDGDTDQLARLSGLSGLPSGNSSRSIYMLVKYRGTGFGGMSYGDPNNNNAFGLIVDNQGNYGVQGWGAGNDFVSNKAASKTRWSVQSSVAFPDSVTHFLDGNPIGVANHRFNTLPKRLVVGANLDGANKVDMLVGAILIYNRVLSAEERDRVEKYLHTKYSLDVANNNSPIAQNDRRRLPSSSSSTISVLKNDTDDGQLDIGSLTIVAEPSFGSIAINRSNGEITYSHNGGSTADSFTYSVRDNLGSLSNVAEVSIAIGEPYTLPEDGLVAHYEADLNLSMEGSNVVSWGDQSGNNNILRGIGEINIATNAINGQPVLELNGRNAAFVRSEDLHGFAEQDRDRSVFLVVDYQGLGPGGFSYGSPKTNGAFGLQVDSDGLFRINGYGSENDFTSDLKGSNAGWVIHSAILTEDGNLAHLVNNELTDSIQHTFDTRDSTLILGADLDQNPFVKMQVAALLVYNRALGEEEQIEVFNYLDDKYGVTSFGVPDAKIDTALVGIGRTVEIDVLKNDLDDGILIPSTLKIVKQPTNGELVVDAITGIVSYTHNGKSTSDIFSYTIEDDQRRVSNESTVSIEIDDDLAPVAENDRISIESSGSVVINVLENDSDDYVIDSDTLVIFAQPTNGTVAKDASTGEITYTHDGLSVSDEFSYLVKDNAGQSSNEGVVSIDVSVPEPLVSEGLVLHLESSNGVDTKENVVTRWNDLSRSKNNLSAKGNPTLQKNVLNGLPVVDLDGAGDLFLRDQEINSLPVGSSNRTVYFLANYRGVGYGGFAYGDTSSNQTFGTIVDSSGKLTVQGWGKGNDFLTTNVATGEGWVLHSVIVEGEEFRQYLNGELILSSEHLFETTISKIVLGAEIDESPSIDMQIAAVLVYDRALTEIEDLRVRNYLTIKYDLETSNDEAPVANNDVLVLPNGATGSIRVLDNDYDDVALNVASVSILQQPSNGVVSINTSTGVVNYIHNGGGYADLFTYVVSDDVGQVSNVAVVKVSNLPSGLVAQFEADTGVTVDDGKVVSWADVSGSGNDLNARGDIELVPAVLNGYPVLDLDGSDDFFIRTRNLTGMPTADSDRSIYLVAQYEGVGSGGFMYGQAAANKAFGLLVNSNGELSVNGYGTANDFVSGVVGTSTGWMVHSVVLSESTLVHSSNGESIDTYEHSYNTVANQMVLGTDLDFNSSVNMQVVALMVFDRALSAEEETEVSAYIQGKYNIQGIGSPQTVGEEVETVAGGTVEIDILLNDIAIEDGIDTSSVKIVRSPAAGQAIINSASGMITYKHNGGSEIADSFSYTVANNQGRISSEATVLIAIDDDLSPIAKDDLFSIDRAGRGVISVLENDLDDNSLDASSLVLLSSPTGGIAVIDEGTGLVRYAHNGLSVSDRFTYAVKDNQGQISNTATVYISINTPNFIPGNDLVLHLESDSGVDESGGLVIGWKDRSGSKNDLIASGDPQLVPDVLNGFPVVDFDGDEDLLIRVDSLSNMPESDSDRTLIMLSNYRGKGYGGLAYGAASDNNAFGAVVDGRGRLTAQGWGAGNDFNSGVSGSGLGWLVQSLVLQDNIIVQYKDGEKIDSDEHTFNTIAQQLVLGASLDATNSVDMQVAVVLVYDRALSAIEQLQIQNFLEAKYDIESGNDNPPIATPDSLVLPSGESADIAVLANDTDDNQIIVSSVSIVRRPVNGSAVVDTTTGSITYSHDGAISGDSFTYTVEDSSGQSSPEVEVTISNLPAGLVAHYEADKGIVLDGETVKSWSDQSAAGNDLIALGSPLFIDNGINDRPAVGFDGVNDLLKRDFGVSKMPIGSNDRSVYFVVNYQGTGNGGFSYGQQSLNKAFGLQVSEQGFLGINGFGGSNNFVSGVSGTNSGWMIQSVLFEGNTMQHAVNGQTIDQYLHNYETGVGPIILGGGLDGQPAVSMQMASLMVFDRALSKAEQGEVQSYLLTKYNVTGIGSPIVNDDAGVIVSGGSVDIDILANDEAVEGSIDFTTVTIERYPSTGVAAVDSDSGMIKYTHNGSSSSGDSFTYTVANDLGRVSSSATVNITIDDDLSPTVVDDVVRVSVSEAIDINVLANDRDDNALVPGSIEIVSVPTGGTVVTSPIDGQFRYTHDGVSISDEFSYTVFDDALQKSDVATVKIIVDVSDELINEDLVLHLEADVGVSISDDVISSWADQSDYGNNLLSVGNPVLVKNALNGLPVIDLSDDRLERIGKLSSLPSGNADRTVFMLAKYDGVGYGGFSYGDTFDNQTFGSVVNSNGRLTVQGWGVDNDFISDSQGTGNGWLVQSIVFDSGNLRHFKDNEEIGSETHVFDTVTNRLTLGSGLSGSPTVDMQVAAVLVYDRALSALQRLQVQKYLATKYDVSSSNDAPPLALDDTLILSESNSASIDVLSNDSDDGGIDRSSLVIIDPPVHGTVSLNDKTGVFNYTHSGISFSDSFTYTITDSLGQVSNTATVNIARLPSGLVAFFESDFGVEEKRGVVSAWVDQSGEKNSLRAAGEIKLVPNSINGKPALDLDGIEVQLKHSDDTSGLPLGSNDRSVYFVVNYEGIGSGGLVYGQQSANKAFGLQVNDDGFLGINGYGKLSEYTSTTYGTGANWIVQSAIVSDNVVEHAVNGKSFDKFLHTYDTSPGPLVVGAAIEQSSAVNMQVAAVLIFNRALDEVEQNQVHAYVNDKYNVVGVGAPLTENDAGFVTPGGSTEIDVLANDSPVFGAIDPSTVAIKQAPSAGKVLVNSSTGIVRYEHVGSSVTSDNFTYTVANDSGRISSEANVVVSVDNDLSPTAVKDEAEVGVASSVILDVLQNDSDDNSLDPSTLTIVTEPQFGSAFVDDLTGKINYTHGGQSTSDSFSYTVSDYASQVSNPVDVEITVTTSDNLVESGLVLHLEGDFGVSLRDNTVVSWADRSSSKNDLTAIGSPELLNNSLNGLPVVSFDGKEDRLQRIGNIAGLPTGNSDRSVFVLGKYEGNGFGGFAYGKPESNSAFGAIVDSLGRLAAQGWGNENDFLSKVPAKDQGWLVQSVVVSSDSVLQYLNGELIGMDTHTYDTVSDRMVLGAGLSGLPFTDMDVAAVLVYDYALNETQQLQVHNYLGSKYQLVTSNELAPIAENDRLVLEFGGSTESAILANDTDDLGLEVSSINITQPPKNGVVSVNRSTGTVTYSHDGSVAGDTFRYTVKDTSGQLSNEATVTVSNLPGGIVAHFESDDGVKVSRDDSQLVSSWSDLSSSDLILLAKGDVVVAQNVINGHPALLFDGTDDLLIRNNSVELPLGSSNRSIFFVVNYQGIGSGGFSYGQSTNNNAFGLHVEDSGLLLVNGFGGAYDFVSSRMGKGKGWIIQSAVLDDNTLLHAVNGETIDNFVHTYATGIGSIILGADLQQNNNVQMEVAALIIYDRALSAEEQDEVHAYLQDKYQIPVQTQ